MDNNIEKERLKKVREFLTLKDELNNELQEITELASEICNKPISLITLLDEHINWIKAANDIIDVTKAPREYSFCKFTIQSEETLIIKDAKLDERFDNNPYVHDHPGLVFYAGAPLITSDGFRLGAMCLYDTKPNDLTDTEKRGLEVLARQVVYLMESKVSQKRLAAKSKELGKKIDSLRAITQLQSYDIRQPLKSLVDLLIKASKNNLLMDDDWLGMVKDVANLLDSKIHSIVNETMGNADVKLSRFNKMVEEIEDYAILLISKDGTIENWNKGAQIIKGYTEDEIIGQNFRQFYTKEQQQQQLPEKLLEDAIANGIARDEGPRVRKDGTLFNAKVVITAIHDEDGEVIGFTKMTRALK